MPSFNLNYLQEAQSPDTVTLGVRASVYKFWGDIIQSMATTFATIKFLPVRMFLIPFP